MPRQPVDLSAHINQTVERGHPADFPVALMPVLYKDGVALREFPNRMAVVREDTRDALAIVSDRYTLVPHQRILDLFAEAIEPLDLGPVPRGIFVDRRGARMRALLKFPSLAQPVTNGDNICPCLKIENSYDTRSRIAIHIGAFRFVCTNLAVGGGGVFAGGFVSVHAGEIPIEEVAKQLATFLQGFESIVRLYQIWTEQPLTGGETGMHSGSKIVPPITGRWGANTRDPLGLAETKPRMASFSSGAWSLRPFFGASERKSTS